MKWKDLKLGIKCSIAFGSIVIILIVVSIWSITGIGGILTNAEEVIDGNKLRSDLEEKYIQHMNWVKKLEGLIYDPDVTEVELQTDPHKCAFGEWFYGNGLNEVRQHAPELIPLLEKMEEPHKELHESATAIMNVYHPADYNLSIFIQGAKADHLAWSNSVKDALLNHSRNLNVQLDPSMCNLGKWINDPLTKETLEKDPQLKEAVNKLIVDHDNLHYSAKNINNYLRQGKTAEALTYFNQTTKKSLDKNLVNLNNIIAYNNKNLESSRTATSILNNKTHKSLDILDKQFHNIINKSADYIMTDKAMFDAAIKTRLGVLIFSVIAAIGALILALVITKGMIKPIRKGIEFAKKIANGDLTAKIDINQTDEIGQMVNSLKNMSEKLTTIFEDIINGADNITQASSEMSNASQQVSQGASEQATSVEEISSSMEEMAANIQQNAENAEKTEKIAKESQGGIIEGYESANSSTSSMKKIAEKISIINEIAFQTNILALNAAVEAARAGEYGKGFAVVASEVRKLAERSKDAAEEIDKVSKTGVNIVEGASKRLSEIVPEIEKTATLIQEIAAASMEQNAGANQINNAIQQLNIVTQQNAASSEEMATSAEELAGQANLLKELISYFRINKRNLSRQNSRLNTTNKSIKYKETTEGVGVLEEEESIF